MWDVVCVLVVDSGGHASKVGQVDSGARARTQDGEVKQKSTESPGAACSRTRKRLGSDSEKTHLYRAVKRYRIIFL